jgi:hypothetical protein
VDTIINNLAHNLACYNTFWIKVVCRASKESISPYVKFLCTQKMLCIGVSESAHTVYFQIIETTCQRCISNLACGLVNCHILSKVYLINQPRVMHAILLNPLM